MILKEGLADLVAQGVRNMVMNGDPRDGEQVFVTWVDDKTGTSHVGMATWDRLAGWTINDNKDKRYSIVKWLSPNDLQVGDIVTIEDDIRAVIIDTDYESLYLFSENGCVESMKYTDVRPTGEHTDLVEMLMFKLQNTEA